MSEISYEEYVISTCSITNEECEGGCNNCQTAISQCNREDEEKESLYIIDLPKSYSGANYLSNHYYTVGRGELSELENVKKMLRMPQELIEKKYVSNEFMEIHYPEWVKTTKILGITEQPEKVIYSKNHCMILIFSDCLYLVAPALVDETKVHNIPEL